MTIHAEQRSPAMLFSNLHTKKNVQGNALCMTSQSRAIMRVRTLGVESRTSKESEKEIKQEDSVLLMLAFLFASGIGVLARAGPFLMSE